MAEQEMTTMTTAPITIDLTGPDWEPTEATRFFAQRGEGKFHFGPTEVEALQNLLAEEAK